MQHFNIYRQTQRLSGPLYLVQSETAGRFHCNRLHKRCKLIKSPDFQDVLYYR